MNELITRSEEKINTLHNEIAGLLHEGIEKAIEIGELLTAKKKELQHGEFGTWIKDNLIFTDRTARNYMRLFENKLKVLEAGNISGAYKILEAFKTETVSDFTHVEFLLHELIYHITNDLPHNDLREETYSSCLSFIENCRSETDKLPRPWVDNNEWQKLLLKGYKIAKELEDIGMLIGELKLRDQRKLGELINT